MNTLLDDVFGMTLAGFAASRGTHPQAVRDEYRSLMRETPAELLPTVVRRTEDAGDGTTKFCLPVGTSKDGKGLESESVIIPMTSFNQKRWYTLCVSSQVGCRMGCTFCETGRMGLIQNLTAAQIVQQRLVARRIRAEVKGLRTKEEATQSSVLNPQSSYFADGIQNVVFMGMGEPLDNFDNVVQAIRAMTEPRGLNFPHGQITVSTVGRIDGLKKLAALCEAEPLWRNLRIAISLNAARDGLRDELMPVNRGMPLAELRAALAEYPLAPKARFLIEYVMIREVNDSPADAAAVAEFATGLPCIVNLIPYNPQRFAAYETPSEERVLSFMADLKQRGLFVKRRVTHGRELMGACGQLGNPEIRRVKLGVSGQWPVVSGQKDGGSVA